MIDPRSTPTRGREGLLAAQGVEGVDMWSGSPDSGHALPRTVQTRRGPGAITLSDLDQSAWDELVDSQAQMIWDIVRNYHLPADLAAGVCTVVWLRMADRIHELQAAAIPESLIASAHCEARRAASAWRDQRSAI